MTVTLHVAWLVVSFFFGGAAALALVGLVMVAGRNADVEDRRELERELRA